MRSLFTLSASLVLVALAGCGDRGGEGGSASSAPGGEFTPSTEAGAPGATPGGAGASGTAPPTVRGVTPAPETLPPVDMPDAVRPGSGVTAPGDPPPTLPPDRRSAPGAADPAGPST